MENTKKGKALLVSQPITAAVQSKDRRQISMTLRSLHITLPSSIPQSAKRLGRPPGKGNSTTAVNRNEAQKELLVLWKRSTLRQNEYAAKISISLAALKSYLNARTKGVPAEALAAARNFDTQNRRLLASIDNRFAGSMGEIIARWESKIAHAPLSTTQLATILEVNNTTVLRWKTNSKPSTRALETYEHKLLNYFNT